MFSTKSALYHGVAQRDNSKFKMMYFRNERRQQPRRDKNSEDLAILILEFVDVTVKKKTICKHKTLLTNGLKRDLKKKIAKTMVWSVIVYGNETLTIRRLVLRDWEVM